MQISQDLIDELVSKVEKECARGTAGETALKKTLSKLPLFRADMEEVRNRVSDKLLAHTIEKMLQKSHPNKKITVKVKNGAVTGAILNHKPASSPEEIYDRHELQLPVGDRR